MKLMLGAGLILDQSWESVFADEPPGSVEGPPQAARAAAVREAPAKPRKCFRESDVDMQEVPF
jgi:hypothetical protein